MKIMIAGYGFVGRAQELLLRDYHEVVIYDPALGHTDWHTDAEAVIVCVSTPSSENGACEMGNVFDIVGKVSESTPILIKSTVSVEGWKALTDTYANRLICFSPEFLRAAHWEEDAFVKQLYLGGNCTQFWTGVFVQALGHVLITTEEPKELIAAKVFRNAFLATKVAFFNQVHDYCESYNLNYDDVKKFIADDERIGHSHTEVTQERGFGGHCFPKDTRAIKYSAQRNNTRLTLIEEAIEYNNSIRGT